MSAQTLLWKGKGSTAASVLLLSWLVLGTPVAAVADHWKHQRNGRFRISDRDRCRNEARRDYRYDRRDSYYQRSSHGYYQRDRNYRQDRYYQRGRDRGYGQFQSYDRNWNDRRYRGYGRERSAGKSALIVAGSTGAGAAVGGLVGGTKGAAVGAIAGGIAGLVYDQHTDNRR